MIEMAALKSTYEDSSVNDVHICVDTIGLMQVSHLQCKSIFELIQKGNCLREITSSHTSLNISI